MRDLKRFEDQKLGLIRAANNNGEWVYCSFDLAVALGYARAGTSSAIGNYCDDIVEFPDVVSKRGRPLHFVHKKDVYKTLQHTKSLRASAVRKWFETEIFPELEESPFVEMSDDGKLEIKNRTGKAISTSLNFDSIKELLTDPEFLLQLATLYNEESKKRKVLEEENIELTKKIKGQENKIFMLQKASSAENPVSIDEFARTLRNSGLDIGANRLLKYLRKNKFLAKGDLPYHKYIESGYFVVKEVTIETPNGSQTSLCPYVTRQGQLFLSKQLSENFDDIATGTLGNCTFENN